jgi:preprotein translocase subunit SecD
MNKVLLGLALAWPLLAGAKTNTTPVLEFRSAVECRPGRAKPEETFTGPGSEDVFFVSKTALLDQSAVKSVRVTRDAVSAQPCLEIKFTRAGQKRFAEVTRQHQGERLAILIDGGLYSAPVIRSEISGGTALVQGGFDTAEAAELAGKINKALN